MPELPDVRLYCDALTRFIVNRPIEGLIVKSPFVLRTIDPPIDEIENLVIRSISHLGKRIVWELENDWHLVFHLMIAGRYHWRKPRALPTTKRDLIAFHFDHGTLMMTEASTKKRASLHLVTNQNAAIAMDPGGISLWDIDTQEFAERLRAENRTLKRALTNPKTFCGIGNAYSDEILWAAHLSPVKLTGRLTDEECDRLLEAARSTLETWSKRLIDQNGEKFPERVTAFRPEMAVHGKAGKQCPECQHPVQRIVYSENETNYCAYCQNDGKVLADRSLSRLLKNDWPRDIEDWE